MAVQRTLSFVFLGLVVVHASTLVQIHEPLITLPIAVNINATGGATALIKADRARFEAMSAHRVSRGMPSLGAPTFLPLSITNAFVTYTGIVGIGRPPTTYTLVIDTGSSNTWVGAGKKYMVTKTSHRTSDTVAVKYGSGSFHGIEYTDMLTFGSKAVAIGAQSIGVASKSTGFHDVDGILGIGPVDLTLGTLSPDRFKTIPTVTDSLKSQGLISMGQMGIFFEPSTVSLKGLLTFGGSDSSKFNGSMKFVSITSVSPANQYWGITQAITYGPSTPILSSSSAGIVDTGTTLLYLPTDAFLRYVSATKATRHSTGLLEITSTEFAKLKSLFFTIGGAKYEFTANAQIWPRHLNTVIGGSPNSIYLVVADRGAESGSGLDFINGFVWLQRFYTVFDTDNRRIGFATTPFTKATPN